MACLLCISLAVCAAAIALKIYFKLTTKRHGSYTSLVGKTAIVTGANSGIGYITALDFAMRGARVILACRSKDRAEGARTRIIKATGNENVVFKQLNLSSLKSVRDFAEDINKTEARLDILVNNAGAGTIDKHYTEDNIQSLIHGNHISPFLLTHLLLGKLKKSAPSRIVNVSSIVAKLVNLDVDKINELPPVKFSKDVRDFQVYSITKLCNIFFTTELARKIDGSGVTVNALHPGPIRTEFLEKFTGLLRPIFAITSYLFYLTPEEGAQTQIHVSVSKDVEGVNGGLFSNCTQISLYDSAKDQDKARKLWKISEDLAKLSDSEKIPN